MNNVIQIRTQATLPIQGMTIRAVSEDKSHIFSTRNEWAGSVEREPVSGLWAGRFPSGEYFPETYCQAEHAAMLLMGVFEALNFSAWGPGENPTAAMVESRLSGNLKKIPRILTRSGSFDGPKNVDTISAAVWVRGVYHGFMLRNQENKNAV